MRNSDKLLVIFAFSFDNQLSVICFFLNVLSSDASVSYGQFGDLKGLVKAFIHCQLDYGNGEASLLYI